MIVLGKDELEENSTCKNYLQVQTNVCYFKGSDSVTLICEVEFIEDRAFQKSVFQESDRKFFSKGIDDPKFRLLKFHTLEATFWIEGKFRTCHYK